MERKNILIRDVRIESRVFKLFSSVSQLIYNSDRETVIPYILTGYLIGIMKKHNLTINENIIDYHTELKNKLYPKATVIVEEQKDGTVISKAMEERIDEELDIENDFIETKPKERITNAE